MSGRQQLVAEIIGGLLALALITADVVLSIRGVSDSGIQSAVPVLVAFYFGGRIAVSAQAKANAPRSTGRATDMPSNGAAVVSGSVP